MAEAKLTAGDPIKNANAILQYALPINNKPIREIQVRTQLEQSLDVPGTLCAVPIVTLTMNEDAL